MCICVCMQTYKKVYKNMQSHYVHSCYHSIYPSASPVARSSFQCPCTYLFFDENRKTKATKYFFPTKLSLSLLLASYTISS